MEFHFFFPITFNEIECRIHNISVDRSHVLVTAEKMGIIVGSLFKRNRTVKRNRTGKQRTGKRKTKCMERRRKVLRRMERRRMVRSTVRSTVRSMLECKPESMLERMPVRTRGRTAKQRPAERTNRVCFGRWRRLWQMMIWLLRRRRRSTRS